MDPLLFLASLVAVLALAGVAHWLGLGKVPILLGPEDARQAANEAVDGFEPVRVAIDRASAGGQTRTGRAAPAAQTARQFLCRPMRHSRLEHPARW